MLNGNRLSRLAFVHQGASIADGLIHTLAGSTTTTPGPNPASRAKWATLNVNRCDAPLTWQVATRRASWTCLPTMPRLPQELPTPDILRMAQTETFSKQLAPGAIGIEIATQPDCQGASAWHGIAYNGRLRTSEVVIAERKSHPQSHLRRMTLVSWLLH